MSKNKIFPLTIMLVGFITAWIYFDKDEPVKDSIIYFPLDEETNFLHTQTSIKLLDAKNEDEYELKWNITSDTGKKVYLRQDISFLFADGQLINKASKWEENSQKLFQTRKINDEDSSHFQSISFHHGEVHYKDDVIKSTQKMSSDQLYVVDSPKQPLESFRVAKSTNEKEWKKILDHATNQQLKYSWMNLIKTYNIPVKKYHMIPLTKLDYYNSHPLPGYSSMESKRKLGQLWEGLYKNYFLGLERKDGTTINPIGSAIPLILVNKDHIIVLIESKDGEHFQLLQY